MFWLKEIKSLNNFELEIEYRDSTVDVAVVTDDTRRHASFLVIAITLPIL